MVGQSTEESRARDAARKRRKTAERRAEREAAAAKRLPPSQRERPRSRRAVQARLSLEAALMRVGGGVHVPHPCLHDERGLVSTWVQLETGYDSLSAAYAACGIMSDQSDDPVFVRIGTRRSTYGVYLRRWVDSWGHNVADVPFGLNLRSGVVMSPSGEVFATKTGKVLTDGDVEALAAEAEAGYEQGDDGVMRAVAPAVLSPPPEPPVPATELKFAPPLEPDLDLGPAQPELPMAALDDAAFDRLAIAVFGKIMADLHDQAALRHEIEVLTDQRDQLDANLLAATAEVVRLRKVIYEREQFERDAKLLPKLDERSRAALEAVVRAEQG